MKYSSVRILALVFFMLVISECKSPINNTIINIDADNTAHAVNLKLSDLADSFKIIPLETTTESLLDDLTEYYCNEDYILAYSENGVFKFSSSGRFIKKLLGSGRGPNEFVNLSLCIYSVDENNDILLINDQMHTGIYFRYDLKSEQFLEPIKQWSPAFGSFDIVRDSSIIVTNFLNKKYAFYYQNFNGEFVSGVSNTKKIVSDQEEILQGGRLTKFGSDYYYSFQHDDTLFKIEDNKLIPYLALNFNASGEDNPKEILENRDERFIVFQPGSPSFFIILVLVDNFENLDVNNRGIGEGKSFYLLVNNYTGKASKINSYTDNFIGKTKDGLALSKIDFLSPFFLKLSPNKRIITPYYPNQIKKAIEKGLNYKDFPVEINEQLLKLNENLQETDNPILMIGTIKNKI
jgi:hypothetical protein